MYKLLTILLIGLVFEAIGVVLLSRGLKEILWIFTSRDLEDATALSARMSNQTDSVSGFLWDQLSSDERLALSSKPKSEQVQSQALLAALNKALQKPGFYTSERFARVPLSSQTQDLLAQQPKGNEVIRLNRLLLEDAFPQLLARQADRKTNLPNIVRLVGRGFANLHILLGVFFEALFFVALLMLMSRAEVSFVWPLTSLSFVVTTFAAKIYLHEEVSSLRWSGVCLIMLGAALISWSEKSKDKPPRPSPALGASGQKSLAPQ